ncbi:class I SAM-dependent methyltransferase [Zavarzinia aquatilis]|uniref:SAM-dependent methyltransferase n=1 Tax=Zavarzinia aquatilis TaxID=2211142 RepID=A0A317EI69_9PROT|nr:class I SAM-dependent methyltransferase [Zavarzinia aquatilis]PWR24925.1 SAM-dependent methyltransferase [Zavarzinia aquatilis]
MASVAPDWDERFRGDEALYGLAPSAFVVDCSLALAHGARVLCLAEGQGRNALALAARGFRVTALDLSATACRQLAARARALNLPLTVRQQDLGLWSAPEAAFDAVIAVYAHMPRLLRRDLHGQIGRALAPGGMVVIEGFRAEQLGRSSGGPRNADWLYSEAELRADFAGFHIDYLATPEVPLDEGRGHQGLGALIRFRARKQG